jgi:predicted ATPase
VTEERREDYVGPTLNRAARLLSAGHGGQVLLNQTTYELVREHLVGDVTLRDLGIHTLKDLLQPEHIYQAAAPGLPADFPPLRTACAAPASLPVQIAPFVGRQVELARIKALLEDPDCRLISLVGMGGSGKTRLGIQAAGESQAFTDGVFFVGLAQALSLDDLTARLADALKLAIYAPRQQRVSPQEARAQLLNYLAGKQFLLILDNFEQLTSQADFLLELLGAAPGIKLIVTSRERLNLPGESVLPVAGLAFPGRNEGERIPLFASVQLFVDRAGRSGYLTVDGADWTAIARICQLVEGIPLAVEMAAAWVKMLSCQEIAAEIERDLDFLTANWRGMPERHHTFRSVFEHSWRLLPEKERDIFCRLSVFAGGFTREAALEVAGAPLHLLASLCDKSFLRRTASGASGRFEIQPILKQYAAEKLAQQPILLAAVQERYAFYYSDWLERMFEKLKGSEQFSALAALRSQVQDLLNACRWLIHVRDLRRLPRAAIGMILYYEMSDQYVELQDVIRLLGEVLRLLVEPPPGAGTPPAGAAQADLLALVLGALRHFVSKTVSQPEQSYHFQQESLQSARGLPDSQTKAFALLLNLIGPGPLSPDQMLELGQECIAIFERLRDAWGAALAQLVSGDIAIFLKEDPVMAHACYQPSLETFSRLGNDWGRAMCLTGLAQAERQVGHPETAYDLVRQSLVIYQRINNPERMLLDRHILGEVAEELGEYLEARDCYETNLAYLEYVGDEPRQPHYRNHLADLEKKLADRP